MGRAVTLVAARSGVTVVVAAEDCFADALQEAGVDVPTGCRGGSCGTCIVRILDGEADHQDVFLTEDEREEGFMTLCVSGALNDRLVIDI